jgi:TRAP transporter TAXI family solute receptor
MGNHHDRRTFIKTLAVGATAAATGLAGCQDQIDQVGGGGGEDFVTIATGGTGGVYYVLGGGLADLWRGELDLETSAESTGASVENARLLESGDVQVALMLANAIDQAVEGEGDFDEPIPLQTLHGVYVNPTHLIVREDSDIETFEDIEGHSIGIGDLGSATELIARDLFEFYGMDYDDVDDRAYSFSENTDAMLDDQLDVGLYSFGLPGPAADELFTQADVRFIDFPEEDLEGLEEEYGYYSPNEIPADTYDGQDEPAPNPGAVNSLVAYEDLDEDMAYDLTTATFENLDSLADVHQVAEDFEEFARESHIEYNPGAESALDDLGL